MAHTHTLSPTFPPPSGNTTDSLTDNMHCTVHSAWLSWRRRVEQFFDKILLPEPAEFGDDRHQLWYSTRCLRAPLHSVIRSAWHSPPSAADAPAAADAAIPVPKKKARGKAKKAKASASPIDEESITVAQLPGYSEEDSWIRTNITVRNKIICGGRRPALQRRGRVHPDSQEARCLAVSQAKCCGTRDTQAPIKNSRYIPSHLRTTGTTRSGKRFTTTTTDSKDSTHSPAMLPQPTGSLTSSRTTTDRRVMSVGFGPISLCETRLFAGGGMMGGMFDGANDAIEDDLQLAPIISYDGAHDLIEFEGQSTTSTRIRTLTTSVGLRRSSCDV
ncbi:hypothetical protein LTR22_004078 [Elasticomyces elasticus]|nr:hypothetical protein LTR22_004078 [Elasticomyces elasticus]KAK4931599.1 hypothetical protein LTR49_001989 [Elasticomyces elasticus]KAK5766758.1 hypothetical protein LTS12_003109 [Elasticomyces elasticus]